MNIWPTEALKNGEGVHATHASRAAPKRVSMGALRDCPGRALTASKMMRKRSTSR
jgi:hypothetical protein